VRTQGTSPRLPSALGGSRSASTIFPADPRLFFTLGRPKVQQATV
jgi:hypothetical protein